MEEKLHDWKDRIDLSPYKNKIVSAANKRERQKLNYESSRQWSKEATNLTGLKGEYAFHLCTGLPIDLELNKNGDSGVDFSFAGITYDVKTTTYDGENPALLEMVEKQLVSSVYVLVQVNDWDAKIIGWASKKQIRHSGRVDFGYGERRCIKQSQMKETMQDTIPPYVPSVSTSESTARDRSKAQLNKKEVLLTLPESVRNEKVSIKKHCFPHGPFDRRQTKTSQWDALYCRECGRFFGYDREPHLIEDE